MSNIATFIQDRARQQKKGNIQVVSMSLSKAIGIINGINEVGNFVQLFRLAVSYLRSRNNGEQEQQIQEHEVQEQQIQEHEVLQLQSDLQILSDSLPSMYNLIDRAEWKSHEKFVAQLLPKLKDAVYDADDLLDEFGWYETKISIEGSNSTQLLSLIEFFRSVIQGSFNKVTDIQKRLNNLSNQLEKMGLHQATPRFEKSIRPVTTSFPTEPKIFDRENEIEEVLRLLNVPNYSNRSSSKRKRPCKASTSGPKATSVPVLPIVGLGGVGKTTLAQEITTLQRVKFHFDKIIWICVSDEFDAERLTKVLMKSLSGKVAMSDNFDDLQKDLAREVGKKRFLLILDDIWPDVVEEDGRNWRKFCAPLINVREESRLLVTTRFAEVADIVGSMKYFELEGLKPDAIWDFFKSCVFGSENSDIDPQLELIGRRIIPKLKGSPLAAKTIGRLLRKSLTTKHWNDILNSELWQLQQKETDILPALRLSYMYLPFHLKKCFSFCAVYPKDYNFGKDRLAEIWVAEGFVEPQGNISLQHIGEQYFEDLVNLSFFQNVYGNYVIHDLMHDMAQLVSKDECFIVKKVSDYEKVPQNVRHVSIIGNFGIAKFASLCKHKRLRTLICGDPFFDPKFSQVMYLLFSELQCLRVIYLIFKSELPDNIGYMKHLRYLKISSDCSSKRLPSSFCCLHNLQILYTNGCVFESLPSGFSNLINLQKFDAQIQAHTLDADGLDCGNTLWLIDNIVIKDLIIKNIDAISKDHAEKISLRNLSGLNGISLRWSSLRSQEHTEVIEALRPPRNIKSIHLEGYPGEYLPWGFHPCNLPTSTSPLFHGSHRPEENINQYEAPMVVVGSNNGLIDSMFLALKELSIEGSQQLASLDQFLEPDCVPAMKKIAVENCLRLSLKSAKFANFCCIEELMVCDCPNTISQGVFSPYLKKLTLKESRNLGGNLMSVIDVGTWSLPSLLELTIIGLNSLTFINGRIGSIFPSLTELSIEGSKELSSLDQFLQPDYVPAIKKIAIENCPKLSLKSAKVTGFCCIEELMVCDCPNIISRGVFSPYLKKLTLKESRNLRGTLMSVLNLEMWSLPALPELTFSGLNSLAFITKANISHHSGNNSCTGTFSSLTDLTIQSCSNLKNIDGLLSHECLPTVRRICISYCAELQCLPSEQFGSFSSLTDLELVDCPRLNWQSRMVLPSSLHRLSLGCCGDISSWFPGCLDNLTSLQSLKIEGLENVVSIPGHLWRNNLPSLEKLEIIRCPDLLSIGGSNAIAHILRLHINSCEKLEEIEQPKSVYRFWLLEITVHP